MNGILMANDEELSMIATPKETRGAKGMHDRITILRINKSEWDALDSNGFRGGVRIADRKQDSCNFKSLYERLRAFNDKLPSRVTLRCDVHTRRDKMQTKSIEITMVKVRDIPPSAIGSRPDLGLAVFFEAPDFKTLTK